MKFFKKAGRNISISALANKLRYLNLNTDPILIYQMGKVGSITVQASLEKAYREIGINVQINRVHLMNLPYEKAKEILAPEYLSLEKTLGAVKNGLAMREKINANPNLKWRLITLVREPIARNVATFFQSLEEFIPDWKERFKNHSIDIEDLQEIFLSKTTLHKGPQNWFDDEMKSVFNIDVYPIPFPTELGYYTYSDNGHFPLLLIRLENLNLCAQEALGGFLGLQNIQIINSNIGQQKEYAAVYQEFKKMPLPLAYVEEMYNTRYAQHFYSADELNTFKLKWTGKKKF